MRTAFSRKCLVLIFAILCGGCATFSFDDMGVSGFRARTDSDPHGPTTSSTQTDRQLGDVVVSADVDAKGCAVNSVTAFDETDSFYVVLETSAFPAGTTFFARLYDEERALEDSDQLTADQDYEDVCVNFAFEADVPWPVGAYQIELFVNGNSYDTVDFSVE